MADVVNARGGDRRSVLIPTSPNRGPGSRRNWVPVKNEPGVFRMIHKQRLEIDHTYQRKINDYLVARMVANWSWIACGVIEVSTRDGGNHWFIVDGQHRWVAARHLDISELPCLCFELDTTRDEAIGFLATNAERRLPSLADQFNALVVSGDPLAAFALKLAKSYDRKIGAPADQDHISCVSDFLRCLGSNKAAMDRVFPVIAEVCKGRPMVGRMFRAVHGLERRMPEGESLSDPRWKKRIVDVGYDAILDSIRMVTQIEHQAGDRSCAQGLLRAINKYLKPSQQLRANVDIVRR